MLRELEKTRQEIPCKLLLIRDRLKETGKGVELEIVSVFEMYIMSLLTFGRSYTDGLAHGKIYGMLWGMYGFGFISFSEFVEAQQEVESLIGEEAADASGIKDPEEYPAFS